MQSLQPPLARQSKRQPRQWPIITGILAGSTLVSLGIVATLWYPYGSAPAAAITDDTPTTAAASEGVGDPFGNESERLAWAASQVNTGLDALEAAFADGDREAWLGQFYTEFTSEQVPAGELESQVGLYFDNLQALQAAPLEIRLLGGLSEISGGDHQYSGRVAMSFCLAPADAATCTRSEVDYDAYWHLRDESLHITQLRTEFSASQHRPQAWEAVELTVAVGERAIVAAGADSGYDPADYLAVADEAAANADRFAQNVDVPSYPVFLAEEDQYTAWYGEFHHIESLGYAAYTAADIENASISGPLQVVIPVGRHDGTASIGSTLRHEFGHTVTLQGADVHHGKNHASWAVEGVAEYIAHGDTMPSTRVSDTATLVADGGCDGDIPNPDPEMSLTTISGVYGCSYLAVRYLVGEYGKEAFMAWLGAMFQEESAADTAAHDHFGKSHNEIMEAITAYIRDQA